MSKNSKKIKNAALSSTSSTPVVADKTPTPANDAKSEMVAPEVKTKRASRLPVDALIVAMKSAGPTGSTVASLATALGGIPERDVRISIDAYRRKNGYSAIVRPAPKTFALPASAFEG